MHGSWNGMLFFFHWFIDVTNWKTECKTEKHWEKVLQEENDIYNCICLDILKFIIGVGDGQGGLACCNSWGHKESDTTEWLNWTDSSGFKNSMPSPVHDHLLWKVSLIFLTFPTSHEFG